MFKSSTGKRSRRAFTPAAVAILLLALASVAAAQETQSAPPQQQQPQQPPPQTQSQPATPPATTTTKTEAQVAAGLTREPAPAKAAEPLYREYRGVTLGMSADEVRGKLGKPEEKSDEMDFFVFSDTERARVYYKDGKASAVIATYLGNDAAAPAPAAVLGAEIEARPDGSMYRMAQYPQAGYWVAYSRTAGDAPLVMITMQKSL